MKRISAALILVLLLLSACSGGENFDDAASFVGEGEMTLIRMLVNSNAYLVEEVFVANHLPVDENNITETADGTFAPVISDKIKTYEDLEKMVYSTYTAETAQKLLSEPVKYTEIDGKLCFNMKYDEEINYSVDWSEPKISAKLSEDGKYMITVKVGVKKFELSAINHNGNIRLEDIYS